jgi:hypothetical protein
MFVHLRKLHLLRKRGERVAETLTEEIQKAGFTRMVGCLTIFACNFNF